MNAPPVASNGVAVSNHWRITAPRQLTVRDITGLRIFLMHGSCRVLGADTDTTRVEVSEITSGPLTVLHRDDGTLVVTHAPGVIRRALATVTGRRRRRSAVVTITVPHECAVAVRGINAPMMVSGIAT